MSCYSPFRNLQYPVLSNPYPKPMTISYVIDILKQSEENLHFLHLQKSTGIWIFAAFIPCELIAFASSEEIYLCISSSQLLKSRFLHMYPSPHAPSSGFLLLHHCHKHINMLKYLPFLPPSCPLQKRVFYVIYLHFSPPILLDHSSQLSSYYLHLHLQKLLCERQRLSSCYQSLWSVVSISMTGPFSVI